MPFPHASFTVVMHKGGRIFPDPKTKPAWDHYFPMCKDGADRDFFTEHILPTFLMLDYACSLCEWVGYWRTRGFLSRRHGPHL